MSDTIQPPIYRRGMRVKVIKPSSIHKGKEGTIKDVFVPPASANPDKYRFHVLVDGTKKCMNLGEEDFCLSD